MAVLEWLAGVPTHRLSRWLVVLVWLVAAGALAPISGRLAGVEQNSQSSFVPAGAASTEVAAYETRFPDLNSLPALVVLYRRAGITAADQAAAIADQRRIAALHLPGVTSVGTSSLSPSGTGLIFPVVLASETGALTVGSDVTRIAGALGTARGGLQQGVGGPAAALADTANAFSGINGTLLLATVSIVTLLLLLTYRSVLMWIFPLLGVGLASVLGQTAVYLLARSGFVVNGMTVGILTVLMFGAGTDYSLLLVARYREELRHTQSAALAMRTALRRVMPTLLTSGGTVMLGLLTLLLAQENDIRALGPVGAIGIASVLVATLTVVPAALVIVGRRAFWPLVPRLGSSPRSSRISWRAVAERVGRHPERTWVGVVLALFAMTFGLTAYEGSLPAADGFTGHAGSVAAQALIDESFPPGISGPVVIAVRTPSLAGAAAAVAEAVPGIVSVGQPETQGGVAIVTATLSSPPSGGQAESVVEALRSAEQRSVGSSVLVGGVTATQVDLDQAASRDRLVVIPVVLVIVFLMLALLLRSLAAPLVLVVTVVISFLASLGVAVLCSRSLFHFAGLDSSVILLGFVFLVALGIDYNVFLAARARQEASAGTGPGMLRALTATGGVITSAGLVLAGTFTVLGVLPLVALTELGFLVAFGVLVDTFLVRSLMVPALVVQIGGGFWWPSHPDPGDGPGAGGNS
ncbi:MAG: MMPL family transporter [Candidatus Dormibacteria bacterium]